MDDRSKDVKRMNLGEDWFDVITQITLSYRRNRLIELPNTIKSEQRFSTVSDSVIQKNEASIGKAVKNTLACL